MITMSSEGLGSWGVLVGLLLLWILLEWHGLLPIWKCHSVRGTEVHVYDFMYFFGILCFCHCVCDSLSECIPAYVVDQAGLQQQISSW